MEGAEAEVPRNVSSNKPDSWSAVNPARSAGGSLYPNYAGISYLGRASRKAESDAVQAARPRTSREGS